jgi:RNA polymerase sigma factor FliA
VPEATIRRVDEYDDAPDDADALLAELWADYVADRDPGLRDRLILHYAPLVKYVAGRVGSGLPAHVEQADLISYGTFGLIDAITRFEPTREVKFESYAMARIRGAIIDELRNTDWIPRSVRMKARQFERTVADLEARLQRTPTDEEVADEMDMDVEEVVVSLYYFEGLTLADIGRVLGVTESRICQLHTKAVLHLRTKLADIA